MTDETNSTAPDAEGKDAVAGEEATVNATAAAANQVPGTPIDVAAGAAQSEPPADAIETVAPSPPADPIASNAPVQTAARPAIKIGSQRDEAAAPTIKAKPQALDTPMTAEAQPTIEGAPPTPVPPARQSPPPRMPDKTTPDMERELEMAMGGIALDDLMAGGAPAVGELEEGSRHKALVLSVRNENVFVDLGGRHQGVASIKQFKDFPEPGTALDVIVSGFSAEDGLYELVVPGAAVDVADWSEITEGMVVEAVITGHNKGGLECEVNRLRGFIPVSQIALYRIEDLEEFVGQRFQCVVSEANPERRNLVLSRRAILEREKAEAKEKLMEQLEVGQMRDGIVRRLQPFGAFVDLGGIDGLLHISQLSWDRVNHPSEVLEEGQKIRVKISKIDPETGKIGLAYRDTFDNPWTKVADKYKPKSVVSGKVSRLTDFGAFVRIEPGVEGLIHISELAHRRVFRAADVVSEGQELDVMIVSVDAEQQRIGLSLKALEARPQKEGKKDDQHDDDVPVPSPPLPKGQTDEELKGGTNRPTGGEQFGLKW